MGNPSFTTISFKFTALDPLKPPLKSTLSALEAIESILEALLALIKPFLLDLTNPLRAVIALLLAAVRAIINQIRSTGFAVLLVHPDFSQQDTNAIINSVAGAYPRFEQKVVGKFFDSSDLFRPQYGPGSTIGMLVFYIGADSPGDLLRQLFALLSLINNPQTLSGLPAPVGVKALPIKKSGDAVAQFRQLFDSDLDQALSIEWRMPEGPTGGMAPGFFGQLVAFYNSFRFPNFLVERTTEDTPQGTTFTLPAKTSTLGPAVDTFTNRYDFPKVASDITLREQNGDVYRNFAVKKLVSGSNLVQGELTGSYRFVDNDSLEPGKNYYYRVRAFFGDITSYLNNSSSADSMKNAGLVKSSKNSFIVNYGSDVVMGKPSSIARGFVPRVLASKSNAAFSPYTDILKAIISGLLLNFELPPANANDSATRQDQKTGWGSLSILGGQISPIKAGYPNSLDFKNNFLVKATARRLTNQVLTKVYSQPALFDLLAQKWVGSGPSGAKGTVDKIYDVLQSWQLLGIIGGITSDTNAKIDSYLALEDSYVLGKPFNGPLPVKGTSQDVVGIEERRALADFIQTAVSVTGSEISYLSWYSVTVGDLFPALIPFIFDFEQFLLSFLKALNSALQEIADIIQTIIKQIQSLEAILSTLLSLLDLLNVNVQVSLLAVGPLQGSVTDLVTALTSAGNKPSGAVYGLHSGMVMTFGAPGGGSLAALSALKFILTIP